MTTKSAIYIASRAFALYLLCWMLSDVTYLPTRIFSLAHHSSGVSIFSPPTYLYVEDKITLAFALVRIAGLGTAAGILLRCGAHVQAFFAPPSEPNP
jgi:hypothetical protein